MARIESTARAERPLQRHHSGVGRDWRFESCPRSRARSFASTSISISWLIGQQSASERRCLEVEDDDERVVISIVGEEAKAVQE
jgi:hypothetical protein